MIQLVDRPAPETEKTNHQAHLDSNREAAAELFRLLGDGTRLEIIRRLIEHGELHVSALCQLLKRNQPAISHHLAVLRLGGIVAVDRRGKQHFYRLRSARFGQLLRTAARAAGERR